MIINDYISFLILTIIICTPPPKPTPIFKVSTQQGKIVQEKISSNLQKQIKDTASSSLSVDTHKEEVNINMDETIHDNEQIIVAKDLASNSYFPSYSFSIYKQGDVSFKVISYSCYKNDPSQKDCTSSFKEEKDQYTFQFNFKLFNNEKLTIKYKYLLKPTKKELYYKKQPIAIRKSE